MSLVLQMTRDLQEHGQQQQPCESDGEQEPRHTELPLFAAADKLQQKKQRRRLAIGRYWLVLLPTLIALGYVFNQYYAAAFWPQGAEQIQAAVLIKTDIVSESGKFKEKAVAEVSVDRQASQIAPPPEQPADNQDGNHAAPAASAVADNTTKKQTVPDVLPAKAAVATIADIAATQKATRAVQSVKTPHPLSPAARDRQTLREAQSLLDSGQRGAAMELLVRRLAEYDRQLHSATLYASLLLSQQRYEDAEQLLNTYSAELPGHLPLAKLQVRLAIAQQRYIDALALLDRYSVPLNRDAEFMSLRAGIYQAQQDYNAAILVYQALLQYDDRQSRWWMGMAVAMDASGRRIEARQAYQSAVAVGDLDHTLSQYATARLGQL